MELFLGDLHLSLLSNCAKENIWSLFKLRHDTKLANYGFSLYSTMVFLLHERENKQKPDWTAAVTEGVQSWQQNIVGLSSVPSFCPLGPPVPAPSFLPIAPIPLVLPLGSLDLLSFSFSGPYSLSDQTHLPRAFFSLSGLSKTPVLRGHHGHMA